MTTPSIRAVIVDDEPVARQSIRILLEAEPAVEVVAECGNGHEAIDLLQREEVDVLFLDIQMPSLQGFQVLEALPTEVVPLVVFVTAYDQHALRAFEVDAVDYLVKPFEDDRFRSTMRRVSERLSERRLGSLGSEIQTLVSRLSELQGRSGTATPRPVPVAGDAGEGSGPSNRLVVRLGKKLEFVDVADIDWIEAEDYCVRLHTGGRSHLLRETLTRLESRLDPGEFVRVHRSAIVRIDRVRQFVPLEHGDGEVVLEDGTRVRVSRTRRLRVNAVLGLG